MTIDSSTYSPCLGHSLLSVRWAKVWIQSIEFDLFLSNYSKDEFFHWRTMQRSLVKSRSFRITTHLNNFFSSSMWRTTKKKKLTKTNTAKLSISSLFSLIQLKDNLEKSTSSQSKSTLVTIQRSDFHSFVQIYFLPYTKQFHSNSKFT